MDVFQMLASDHRQAERLFERLGAAADADEKRRLFAELEQELDVHAQLEEEIFYPALRHDGADPLLDDSLAEHAGIKRMVSRMNELDADSEGWRANLEELSRAVSHHVHEEETRLFPQAREVLSTRLLESLAERISARKAQLQRGGGESDVGERGREAAERARSWVSENASGLAQQARSRSREFLEQQSRSAAANARDVADALRGTGEDLNRRGRSDLSQYVMQAADGLNRLSDRLAKGDVDDVLRQVTETARRHPGALFGGAIATGFLVSRFLKSSESHLHDQGGSPGESSRV